MTWFGVGAVRGLAPAPHAAGAEMPEPRVGMS